MSRLRDDYEGSRWAKFLGWVNGTLEEETESLTSTEVLSKTSSMEHQDETEDKSAEVLDKVSVEDVSEHKDYMDTLAKRGVRIYEKIYKFAAVFISLIIIGVFVYTISFLPRFGAADTPDNNEVPARYIEQGLQETGAVNIVTGMILDYRAFDTFGEANVLYISVCAVFILMRIDSIGKKKSMEQQQADEDDQIYEPMHDTILQQIAKVLVPPIMIFGIYVILNGHLSPGGGFSGGAIIGAALILYLNAFGFKKTQRFFTMKTFKGISFAALGFYALSKSYSFFTGANHIESHIPLGTPGNILSSGLILPLNICVGLVVTATMYGIYAIFRKGGM